MGEKTTTSGRPGVRERRLLDTRRERALLRAMRSALRRSVVLLPLSEEDDMLQQFLETALGAPA